MKELNKFRNFINEGKFEIGDKVTMTSGGEDMEIIKSRRMFGSNVNAYTVKNVGGDEYEYDESQLKLAESLLNESAPGYDTRKFGEALPTLESVQAAYEDKEEPRDGVKSAAEKLGMKPSHVKEGVWNMPTMDEVIEFVAHVEEMKDKFYHIGSDDVFNGLDQAIIAAKNLVDPGDDDSYDSRD